MSPYRMTVRRCFIFLIAAGTLVFLIINIKQKDWPQISSSMQLPQDKEVVVKSIKLKMPPSSFIKPHQHNVNLQHKINKTETKLQKKNFGVKRDSFDSNVIVYENKIFKIAKQNLLNELSNIEQRPWFIKGGKRRPKPSLRNKITLRRIAKLFPHEDPTNDRIINQLMFVPPNYDKNSGRLKKILVFNGLSSWSINKPGKHLFRQCPVSTCSITANRNEAPNVDAILFKDHFTNPFTNRPPNQVWILYFLECPYHTPHIIYPDAINWTATYRSDSDIVTPYERWAYYDDRVKQLPFMERNYAENKTHKVAWFVSNCGARNGRLQYAKELQKYIDVDIYGACGSYKCPRSSANKCFELLDHQYKFYLAFENSNCKDYITEKFFVNGLGRNVLPIVMGAPPEDYEKAAPYKSFIHVDEFESPKQLAEYLHKLDKDDDLYNSYFRWKGTGEFINTYFWCRLCAMLHDDVVSQKYYADINEWWRGTSGICTNDSWRRTDPLLYSSSTTQANKPSLIQSDSNY